MYWQDDDRRSALTLSIRSIPPLPRKNRLGYIDLMFGRFDSFLNERGYMTHQGTIIGASIINFPKQRNTHDENKQIKSGRFPKVSNKSVLKALKKILRPLRYLDETKRFRF